MGGDVAKCDWELGDRLAIGGIFDYGLLATG
jgi:hypothetical protein